MLLVCQRSLASDQPKVYSSVKSCDTISMHINQCLSAFPFFRFKIEVGSCLASRTPNGGSCDDLQILESKCVYGIRMIQIMQVYSWL